ncbi:kinase-like domain-containing protein [Protomyces lactucae-debilis]|uniref:Kinase-like domain-containing protein n=1 Tax=Protomyces lactucae-debilis TaxID=2754530 RepID=A0A1Y2FV01_PROLT|nr:kinase-like domain-containing protein [Protomyces lactucae-debilis]ORY87841.1 kinase-like domain-containing protein [Protomyces lactucae-debilis]
MSCVRGPPSTLPIGEETVIPLGQHVLDVARDDGVYATLHMRSPFAQDVVLSVEQEKLYRIGRGPSSNLVLTDARVSCTHFTLHSIRVSDSIDNLCFLTDTSSNGTYVRYAIRSHGSPNSTRLVGKDCCVLLSDGDDIEIRHVATFTFKQHYQYPEAAAILLKDIRDDYKSDTWLLSNRLIGSGSFGHVLMAHNLKTGKQACCKIIKQSTRPQQLRALKREVEVLQGLSHPNVIMTLETAITDAYYYLFCEMLCGGDCFSYWHAPTSDKSEIMVAFLVYQVLEALDYLHSQNIVHRDLKLENILMAHHKDACRVVLTDFGLARRIDTVKQGRDRMLSVVGTVNSIAPEILEVQPTWPGAEARQGYGAEVDLWSLGVLVHEILLDYSPFALARDMTPAAHMQAIARPLDFVPRTEDGMILTTLAKSFLLGLLQPDPAQRMTIQEAKAHPWLSRHTKPFDAQYHKLLEALPQFGKHSSDQVFQTPAPKRKLAIEHVSSGLPSDDLVSSPCKRLVRNDNKRKRRILIELDPNSAEMQYRGRRRCPPSPEL